jgi:hypothetical protein
MSQRRGISRVVNVPPVTPGFIGPGHLAAPVVSPEDFEKTDPFILLMDDRLDIGDRPVGGRPHPHAGFETVTLILDGAIDDRDEGGTLKAGEVQWMTAGSGIITAKKSGPEGRFACFSCGLRCPRTNAGRPRVFKPFMSIRFLCAANTALRSESIAVPRAGYSQARETRCQSLWSRSI